MRREISLLSLSIAEQVIRRDLKSDEGQKQLIDKLVDEVSIMKEQ